MLPAAAQAQYPYDWHCGDPAVVVRGIDRSSCQPREQYIENSLNSNSSALVDPRARNSEGNSCFKPVPFSPELGEGLGYFCNGAVSYSQTDGSPDNYQAVWDCSLASRRRFHL